ncbi:MAG TPA: tetratricopeptide repeat protein [Candidatus Obscuribacterales bacterium]
MHRNGKMTPSPFGLAVAIVFSMVPLLSGCSQPDDMTQAQTYLQERNYEAAIASIDKAIAKFPRNGSAYYQRAGTYLLLKKYEKVVEDTSKAIEIYKEDEAEPGLIGTALALRAVAYNKLGKHQKAIGDYTEAIKADSRNEHLYYQGRAHSYKLAGQYQKAVDDLSWLVDWEKPAPDSDSQIYIARVQCEALMDRAEAYDKLHKPALAAADRAKAKKKGYSEEQHRRITAARER